MDCSQDEFGATFGLNRGNMGQYIREVSVPKLETLQRIAAHFEITLDDLVNRDLTVKDYDTKSTTIQTAEPIEYYKSQDTIIEALKETVSVQRETIETQKTLIENLRDQLEKAS